MFHAVSFLSSAMLARVILGFLSWAPDRWSQNSVDGFNQLFIHGLVRRKAKKAARRMKFFFRDA